MCARAHTYMCTVGSSEHASNSWAIRDLTGHHCGNGEGAIVWGWPRGYPSFFSFPYSIPSQKCVQTNSFSDLIFFVFGCKGSVRSWDTFYCLFAHPCQCFSLKKGLSLHKNTNGNQQKKGIGDFGLTAMWWPVDLMWIIGRMSASPIPLYIWQSLGWE